VRANRRPIDERGVIRRPDLVVVADDTLVPVPAAGVMAGVDDHGLLLIRTAEAAETWKARLATPARVLQLPISEGDPDRTGLKYVGAACAGAAARLLGVVSLEALAGAVRVELGHLGEKVVLRNLEEARRGYVAVAPHAGAVAEGGETRAESYEPPDWVELPFEEAGVSAPVIHAGLTSLAARTGLWRTLRPVIDQDRCKGCWWVCSSLCPDGAIAVAEGRPAIDYDHCKGCLVCVAVCPAHAVEARPEQAAEAGEARA
jgi:pyruvate ferredoxin oxidoreductase gamma subunit